MHTNSISVSPSGDGRWRVAETGADELETFRLKAHALAFARAVALSRGVDLFVAGRNGGGVRQGRHTLTYPTTLD